MRVRQRMTSWLTPVLVLVGLIAFSAPVAAKPGSGKHRRGDQRREAKLDRELKNRSTKLFGTSRVIIIVKPGQEDNASQHARQLGGRPGRKLKLIDGMVVELPNRSLRALPSALKW